MSILCARTKNNNIILIDDLENYEDVFCIDCKTSLIVKRGNIRTHHFAHNNLTNCCSESSHHFYVKEFIKRNINKILFSNKCSKCYENEYENFKNCKVVLEQTYEKYKLDCAIFENNELICVIEVYHTHLTDQEKIHTIINNEIGYYEICTTDVTRFLDDNNLIDFKDEIILKNITQEKGFLCEKCIQGKTHNSTTTYKVKRYCKNCKKILSLNNTRECLRIKFCKNCILTPLF